MRHIYLILANMTALTIDWATAIIRCFIHLIRWGQQSLVDLSEGNAVVMIMKHRRSILRLLKDCIHLTVLMETWDYVLWRHCFWWLILHHFTAVSMDSLNSFRANIFRLYVSPHIASTLPYQTFPLVVKLGSFRCISFVISQDPHTWPHGLLNLLIFLSIFI